MRLIDADALKTALAEMWYENNIRITGLSVAELIDNAPTIEPSKSTDQNVADVPSGENTETKFYDSNGEVYAKITRQSGDTISRADALEQMAQAECGLHYEDCEADKCFCSYIQRILDLPSADRPKGEWVKYKRCDPVGNEIYAITEAPDGKFFCNQCGKYAIKSDFCPHCGADMRPEK